MFKWSLRCKKCERVYPLVEFRSIEERDQYLPILQCDECFGPIEVYDEPIEFGVAPLEVPIEIKHPLDVEFSELYNYFVSIGGLDFTSCPSEDYERVFRTKYFCRHNVMRKDCKECNAPPSGGSWGYPYAGGQ